MPDEKISGLHYQSDTMVVLRPSFPDIKVIQDFCKKYEMPIINLKARSEFDAAKQVHKNLDNYGLTKLIIIGDKDQFPCLKFNWENETGYTDIIYSDPLKDGNLTISVGRIYGSTETILAHLECKYGDSNEAVVFDTAPRRSELPVRALEDLGFYIFLAGGFTDLTRRMMEPAEFILQYSDGTIQDRIHGEPKRWYGGHSPRTILDYNNVHTVDFKYYPVVYSEACYTANFGPLLHAFLTKKAVYVGSTTPTYNNNSVCDSWDTCHFCDGYKYGFLDLLDSHDTVGDVKRGVDFGLLSTLDPENRQQYENLLNQKSNELKTIPILSTIQNMLFGNPNRPNTVGAGNGQFDITKIPVTIS